MAKRSNTKGLPCLVCKTNGLYSKNKRLSPFQNIKGKKVSTKTKTTIEINRSCLLNDKFRKEIPYKAATGTRDIKRVDANNPINTASETICSESLISLFLSHTTIVAESIIFVIKSLRTTDSYQYAGDITSNSQIHNAVFEP